MLKKTLQRGFTIVELLIVIVVIAILAALVLNTFAGVQERARNTERQTDVNAIATHLEVYYNDHGGYPQYTQIDTDTKALAAFPGIDAGAFEAPGQDFSLANTATPTNDQYGYQPIDADGDPCAVDDACVSFTLYYLLEGSTTPETEASLNQ